jgi:hypothetical protein
MDAALSALIAVQTAEQQASGALVEPAQLCHDLLQLSRYIIIINNNISVGVVVLVMFLNDFCENFHATTLSLFSACMTTAITLLQHEERAFAATQPDQPSQPNGTSTNQSDF